MAFFGEYIALFGLDCGLCALEFWFCTRSSLTMAACAVSCRSLRSQ